MSHYHFHIEKAITSDGTPKNLTSDYIVAAEFANSEHKVAIEMGYSVEWSACNEEGHLAETAKA